jgi:hypothetical protein
MPMSKNGLPRGAGLFRRLHVLHVQGVTRLRGRFHDCAMLGRGGNRGSVQHHARFEFVVVVE